MNKTSFRQTYDREAASPGPVKNSGQPGANIPVHRSAERLQGEIAIMRSISEEKHTHPVDYAHRDDYYIFLFIEKGSARLLLDFEEHEVTGSAVCCVLPGQIHLSSGVNDVSGWALIADSIVVKDEYKEVLEKASFMGSKIIVPDENAAWHLKYCASAIHKLLKPDRQRIEQHIVIDLLSHYIGIIAEMYHQGYSVSVNNRLATITFQFKSLLSASYMSLKRPSQYAAMMNISPVYLNEAVKKTTGLTVSHCIHNEVVVQAKRLLFYTDMNIKEISLKLGYDDWAYFTRLFTKASKLSPTQFRKKYLK